MNCSKIQQQMTAYVDGEIPHDQASLLEAHVEECPGCMKLLEDERKLWMLLTNVPGVDPSPDFVDKLWQRAARVPTSPGWWTRVVDFLRPEGLFAPSLALVASFLLCVWVYTHHGPVAQFTLLPIPSVTVDAVEAVLSPVDREVVHHLPFLTHMDIINNLDVVSNLEVLAVMGSSMADDSSTRNVSR